MEITLRHTNSHHVEIDSVNGPGMQSEEVYGYFTVKTRGGTERDVTVSADRYRHSSGLSDWRIYPRDVRPDDGVGPSTMREIREASTPMMEKWLASADYRTSRRQAFATAIKRLIRDVDYSSRRADDALARFADELAPADRRKLAKALRLRIESLNILDEI